MHAHGLAQRLGQHGGIGGCIALVVAPVGPRAEHPDHMHLVAREPDKIGNSIGGVMRFLGRCINRRAVSGDVGHRAAGAHAGVGMCRIFIFAADHARGLRQPVLEMARLTLDGALGDFRLADVLVHLAMRREIRRCSRPRDFQRA